MLSALKFLKPNQNNTGKGAVQVGSAGGSVHVDNRTQRKVTHVQHLHVTNIYAVPPPPAPPRPRYANEAQREVLRFLVGMRPNDGVVFDFMEREFGTRMVIELDDLQLKRAKRYAETVKARAAESGRTGAKSHANHEFL